MVRRRTRPEPDRGESWPPEPSLAAGMLLGKTKSPDSLETSGSFALRTQSAAFVGRWTLPSRGNCGAGSRGEERQRPLR